eukprot:1196413-Prorocentrum_minimum.AAC.1
MIQRLTAASLEDPTPDRCLTGGSNAVCGRRRRDNGGGRGRLSSGNGGHCAGPLLPLPSGAPAGGRVESGGDWRGASGRDAPSVGGAHTHRIACHGTRDGAVSGKCAVQGCGARAQRGRHY